jgi:hypothetical protein
MARCAATRTDLTDAQRALLAGAPIKLGPRAQVVAQADSRRLVAVVHSVSFMGFDRRGDAVASTFGLNTDASAAGGIASALIGPAPRDAVISSVP